MTLNTSTPVVQDPTLVELGTNVIRGLAVAGSGARARVFPPGVPVLSIEAGSTFGWGRDADASIGIDHFGVSAPVAVVMEKFGFTPEHVVARAPALLAAAADPGPTASAGRPHHRRRELSR
jgi:hypothetical protein